ncbi:MAG: hypothetical protein EpisKO_03000 [Epibacterium sp.]
MRYSVLLLCAGLSLAATIWLTLDEDPKRRNHFNAESTTLKMGVLAPEEGITLALTRTASGDTPHMLLITEANREGITAIDLTAGNWTGAIDFFEVLDEIGAGNLAKIALRANRGELSTERFEYDRLLPAAGSATRHVASGTNFPEHQEETNAQGVFNFPKFGAATPPVTSVETSPQTLLDYEVEICARFDRDIKTVEDFDAARKGFFLCGDFTDRAVLSRLVDPDNLDSGTGFSDAKSGPGQFPSGGFFVVPNTWQDFVAEERLVTWVNEELRQDTRAGDMILSFRDLIENVLADTQQQRFLYRNRYWHLVNDGTIGRGQVLMSGTAEGVIFMPPTLRQILRGALKYVTEGDVFKGTSPYTSVVASFIEEELASGRYLQPDDRVTHLSSHMGLISTQVVEGER